MTTVARRLATLLLALTTAACALTNTGDPSVAAIVGDKRITTAEVDEQFDALRDRQTTGEAASNLQAQLVSILVLSEILQISDADVDAAVDEMVEQVGGREAFERQLAEQGVQEDAVHIQTRAQEIQAALQERANDEGGLDAFVRDQVAGVRVEVNPRYGRWSARDLQVQPIDPFGVPGQQAPADTAP